MTTQPQQDIDVSSIVNELMAIANQPWSQQQEPQKRDLKRDIQPLQSLKQPAYDLDPNAVKKRLSYGQKSNRIALPVTALIIGLSVVTGLTLYPSVFDQTRQWMKKDTITTVAVSPPAPTVSAPVIASPSKFETGLSNFTASPPEQAPQNISVPPSEPVLQGSIQLRGADPVSTFQKPEPANTLTAALPETKPAPLSPELERLMNAAEKRLQQGDISGARSFLERAADENGKAAFRMAETYDQVALLRWNIRGGVRGDQAKARKYYERARDLGEPMANERLLSIK